MSDFLRVVGAPVLVLSIGDLATLCPKDITAVMVVLEIIGLYNVKTILTDNSI